MIPFLAFEGLSISFFDTMPYNQKPLILGLSIAFPVVATAAVILRFEARRVKRLRFGADDWTILAALVRLSACLPLLAYIYVT